MKDHLNCLIRMIVLTVCGSICVLSGAARAEIYEMQIRNMEVAGGADHCQEILSQGAASFAAASGATLLGSECQSDFLGRTNGRIVYSSAERITPWSTHRFVSSGVGFFTQEDACQASLTSEIELVRGMTGLVPFLAFCYRLPEVGSPRYSTRIEAVGSSSVSKFETYAYLDYSLQNPTAVAAILEEKARRMGLYPVTSYSGKISVTKGFAMSFYAENEPRDHHRLNAMGSRFFTTIAACERAMSDFSVFGSEDWNGLTACSTAHPNVGFQLNLIWWDSSLSEAANIRSIMIPGDFAEVEACQASAAEIVTKLRGDGINIVGLVCGRDSSPRSPVKMEIFSQLLPKS